MTGRAYGASVLAIALAALGCAEGAADRNAAIPGSEPPPESAPASYRCDGCNLLMVVIDTLRADHLPCYGYERDTAPHLCGLAESGLLFENLVTNAPSTKPAIASLFTSLLPNQHRTVDNPHALPPHFVTLGEVMKDAGYTTVGVAANGTIATQFGYDQGFDTWIDVEGPADVVNAAVEAELDGLKEPFFLYVHYMDPHTPYGAPEPYTRYFDRHEGEAVEGDPAKVRRSKVFPPRLSAKFAPRWINLYDSEIRYVDERINDLLANLDRRRGNADDTLQIVLSDHGEAFGEHGLFQHSVGVNAEVTRVPLIIRFPGGTPRGRVARRVQTIDLMPTVVDVLGIPFEGPVVGASVFSGWSGPERPVLIQNHRQKYEAAQALLEGDYKLVWRKEKPPPDRMSLYDIASDPRELDDLLRRGRLLFPDSHAQRPEAQRAREMLERLKEFRRSQIEWARAHWPEAGQVEIELDNETIEKLRALGYIQ